MCLVSVCVCACDVCQLLKGTVHLGGLFLIGKYQLGNICELSWPLKQVVVVVWLGAGCY